MKNKKDDMKNKKIRITEGELRGIINKTIRRIVNEGKVVNNKPYFSEYYSGRTPKGTKIKAGRKAYIDGYSDWDLEGNAKEMGVSKYNPDLYRAMKKHNDRVSNYKLNGHRYGEANDRYATLWGSKEAEDELLKDRKEERERKLGRGRINPTKDHRVYGGTSLDSPGRLVFNDYGEFMGVNENKIDRIVNECINRLVSEGFEDDNAYGQYVLDSDRQQAQVKNAIYKKLQGLGLEIWGGNQNNYSLFVKDNGSVSAQDIINCIAQSFNLKPYEDFKVNTESNMFGGDRRFKISLPTSLG